MLQRHVVSVLGSARNNSRENGADGKLYLAEVMKPLVAERVSLREFVLYEWFDVRVNNDGYKGHFTGDRDKLAKTIAKSPGDSDATKAAAAFLTAIENFFTLSRSVTVNITVNHEEKSSGSRPSRRPEAPSENSSEWNIEGP